MEMIVADSLLELRAAVPCIERSWHLHVEHPMILPQYLRTLITFVLALVLHLRTCL